MSDRPVTTDALATLGMRIEKGEKRDAIHLAVIPVQAGDVLKPGDHVEFYLPGQVAHLVQPGKGVGIVDPFRIGQIEVGEWFWLVIYPREIRSLRHVWTHPAFPDEPPPEGIQFTREESAAFLTTVAERLGVSLEDVEQMRSNGSFRVDIDGDRTVPPTFWTHFANYTGRKIPEWEQADYFHCGC